MGKRRVSVQLVRCQRALSEPPPPSFPQFPSFPELGADAVI